MNKTLFFTLLLVFLSITTLEKKAFAYTCCATCSCSECSMDVQNCDQQCGACSQSQESGTQDHFSDELENHKFWMAEMFWRDAEEGTEPGLLAAMMLMTEQLTANALLQTEIIGGFFDAKHQLETQRLFQTLTARAHKDYQPSQELCAVGTVTRSLASSERKSDLVAIAFSKRNVDRQLLSKDTLEMTDGIATDQRSRLVQFIRQYCNPLDNASNLDLLCKKGGAENANKNKDVSYTSTIDSSLTLDINLTDGEVSSDEEAFFALTANLFAHEAMPNVPQETLMSKEEEIPAFEASAVAYLDSRALVAKRSVAANSLASIAALKASGNPEAQPFIYALIQELSPDSFSPESIAELIGTNPSYYAQMEILTKKLYQNPKFYSDLYDKPANVLRKDVAIQAAELMQKRDIYRSLLRAETVLSVMLETALLQEQEKITNELNAGTERANKAEGPEGG